MQYFDVSKFKSVTNNSFRVLKFVKIRKLFTSFKNRKMWILELRFSPLLRCRDHTLTR